MAAPKKKPAVRNTALDEAIKRAGIVQTGSGYKLPAQQFTVSTPTPSIQPFFNPTDTMNGIDRESATKNALWDIDKQVADLRAQTGFELQQTEKGRKQNAGAATDNMAARGLSQSSIKDAELFDIEATARMRKDFLNSQLARAETDAGTRKTQINDEWTRWQEAMGNQAVENARQAMEGVPATTQTQGSRAAAYTTVKAPGKNGKMLTWHIYPNGRKVAVK